MVTGEVIYPHRPDLAHLNFWHCEPCNAYVGCHRKGAKTDSGVSDGTLPLGLLANAQERMWRSRVHACLDPIWKKGRMRRSEAYALLAQGMGIPKDKCHVGMFTVQQCQNALSVIWSI